MTNSELIGGIDTFILYSAETTYGSAITATLTFQGIIGTANFDVSRQVVEHAGFTGTGTAGARATAKYTTQTLAVKGGVDFKPQRFDWLQYVLLGTRTGSGTTGSPYSYPLGKTTKSITISEELDNVTTDSQRTYAGIVINSASIRCSVGEAVSVSLELLGGKAAKDTTIGTAVATLSDDLYNFAGGTIEMPDGTSIGNVIDSVEITINNNYMILYGFNEEAVNARPGKLNLGIKFTVKYLDDDQWDRLMGSGTALASQTPVTLAIKFTRATSGAQYADFVFSNVVINRIADSHNLNEFMIEDSELIAQSLTVTEVQS